MEVVVYGRSVPHCGYCESLKTLLKEHQVAHVYKDIANEDLFEEFMSFRLKTVPAVFVDGQYVGGFTETKKLIDGGEI